MIARKFSIAAAVMAFAFQAGTADARSRCKSDAEADIESLDAKLYCTRSGYEMRIRYEVEIEDAHPAERFDLVLSLRERRRPVLDRHGRAVQILVPLDHPTEIDDDEIEFEHQFLVRLDGELIQNPKRLKLYAVVVPRGGGRPLDDKKESVDFKD